MFPEEECLMLAGDFTQVPGGGKMSEMGMLRQLQRVCPVSVEL